VQLHQPAVLEALSALDARLLVIAFANVETLSNWIPSFQRTMLDPSYGEKGFLPPAELFARTRFASDQTRAVYHAYGLGRNSALRVYGPRILWQYLKWGLAGRPIHIQDDTLQRGGDFVVGRDGQLTLAHVGRDQAERPSVDVIVDALRRGRSRD
jgi:hypothetical protein